MESYRHSSQISLLFAVHHVVSVVERLGANVQNVGVDRVAAQARTTYSVPSRPPHSVLPGRLRRRSTERKRGRVWYRSKLKELSPEEQEAATLRAREARARYRERHRAELLHVARCKRLAAYAEKYGMAAYEAKIERKEQRMLERQERPRRRDRVKPSKKSPKPSRNNVEVPVRTPIIHPYQYVYPVRD
ncbi:hypothetical protein C8R47DRAFT_1084620 [Mycena vitilis]|nr:hypothetical protein C8R47DRAFT_1084620 [Mycena vitilis]